MNINIIDSIFILGYIILTYVYKRNIKKKLSPTNQRYLRTSFILGALTGFFGWEYAWSLGKGYTGLKGESYSERFRGKFQSKNLIHALVMTIGDGFVVAIIFLLGILKWKDAFILPNYQFYIFVITIGVIQNILISKSPFIGDLHNLAPSLLAPFPNCKQNIDVCVNNQLMWLFTPSFVYFIILLLANSERVNNGKVQKLS